MPQQPVASIQNKFTKGLITEFSGLSFPENAATDCDNTLFTIVGNVTRRLGVDVEEHGSSFSLGPSGFLAKSSYVWKNVSGDGNLQLEVIQSGSTLSFFSISASTTSSPLSLNKSASTVNLLSFVAAGGSFDNTLECQYTGGNGYLFVVHPSCDPVYCTYNAGTITGTRITVRIRDFIGVPDGLAANTRPTSLSVEHNYNLINQGWVAGNPWSTLSSTPVVVGLGSKTFTVSAGLAVTLGNQVTIFNQTSAGLPANNPMMSGNITAYTGTSMTINVTSGSTGWFGVTGGSWLIVPRDTAYISTWFSSIGNYPSNADVWWYFRNSSGAFDPGASVSNVSLGAGNAPRGHFILDAFSQQRDVVSSLAITDIQTTVRPNVVTWFQGRVWYTGVTAQQPATGNANAYTWTESIYFSKIVNGIDDFGACYQVNDPTSEQLFDLLPTDGGVINIQGVGTIFKLFPYQNGLLVFAANGIKFITGSQGIGFTANDYTITDISSVRCISSTSFVDVLGIPYFWNEDGIYSVQPSKNGGMTVDPITVSTILSFYNEIPLSSKKYVRGAYHPIDYIIQWIYQGEESTSIVNRYSFNKILNYNTYNQAFFPYTIDNTITSINTIDYVAGPGGLNTPPPIFKYLCTNGISFYFADEHDDAYVDWSTTTEFDYNSYFITGYQIRGQAQKMFFPGYVWMFSTSSDTTDTAYKFNSIWDYATSGNSGRWSIERFTEIPPVNYGIIYKRHKIRGHGLALQFKVQSVFGKNFDIIGWTSSDNVNTGI